MSEIDVQDWPERIRQRYENYLKTSFFFKEPVLRASFEEALPRSGKPPEGAVSGTPSRVRERTACASARGRVFLGRRRRSVACPD